MIDETLDENFIEEGNEKEKYYRAYFGNDADYYLREIEALKNERSYSLNFWPFLFGLLWMFYKKLYVPGFVLLGTQIVIGFAEDFIVEKFALGAYQIYFDLFWMLAVGILLAFYGNVLYLKKAEKDVEAIISETQPGQDRYDQLAEKGRNNPGAVIIFILILIIISMIGF
ncbi:DUF2628 domain-containing protein [Fulvivirga ligni]|uniref:DUF2628 domain-containing protein n=1 Tax=Fulvivirga ligni TaxID=2904246 RepID=UPI001F332D1D|nr:DUF2628 domain-containing protein [Fulvivirga ligni]UII22518.1 DUF2628 domain-containing protein [Fulvivirga ligni]